MLTSQENNRVVPGLASVPDLPGSVSRRDCLRTAGTGLGMLGLIGLLNDQRLLAAGTTNPLAARPAEHRPRARHIIHIYLNGGPSQIDTFDPKPALARYAGKPLPTGNLTTERPTGGALPSPFKFRKYGESGLEFSEIFARTAEHADDIAIIRSMVANTPNHEQSMRLMNCGSERLSRPSYGAWLTYGLGTENANLPGFIAMCPGYPVADVSNWRSAFLPGIYQGTHINTKHTQVEELIENIRSSSPDPIRQRNQLGLLRNLNQRHLAVRPEHAELEARIESFELAYRMQSAAAEAFDLSGEPQYVLDAYGHTVQGRQLLLARRLVERGVRVVQCYHGDVQPWDAHSELEKNHRELAGQIDPAIGALLSDLKQRGMLDETLVLCGGEFGRTPSVELPQPGTGSPQLGRDHNHWGFSVWMAGGGVRGGTVYGATDEFGFRAIESPVHVHDLHATMLYLMGFDHEHLTYRYAGRDFRLTDVHGRVVHELVNG